MNHCDQCHESFDPIKYNQRFCGPICKAAWHLEHNASNGRIKSIRRIKSGKWSVTVHFLEQPSVHIGQEIALSAAGTRTERKTG
jgi:recombinational DNA repair protein (RecF pathway)